MAEFFEEKKDKKNFAASGPLPINPKMERKMLQEIADEFQDLESPGL